MPRLWNTSKMKKLETKHNGTVYEFPPTTSPKDAIPIYYKDVVNHLIYKLMPKGLVELPEESTPEQEKKLYILGMKRRRSLLKDILVHYQTANNERGSRNQGKIEPNDTEVEAVKEIRLIEQELDAIDGPSKEDRALVSDYFEKQVTEDDIDSTQKEIIDDGVNQPELASVGAETKKRVGRPQKAQSLKA